ncbi:TIGR04283 family arsenosugar biosynthesis glycosyltransferase [Aetokthonos hydrillicola Thurmond2011]|jgi:rSAM/selenodomain-associated transferase 2|uniref:4,4'-diaponeurosporenoate glycosyltransferase n=1 Tax=Aetokthonos hydrillicola Thurmond2011 TaxID=2712845 RepID=A0AAP5I9V8_9CYAN|nr:TIGR04283 family arsenosugar biosynthesis glycosyltransferase [Aetokthonos hydrillicola]MBO3461888.1 glycosyltransferase [Aetokthonos hydrillicola CCALA 1050]MBW4586770.1 TIGR04283 family arsenosugar biosynthesis glycosyltransferase [Aetokthonos hydrillicola CCALA 1050]MDR9895873.1 TIGR04283 family arsenosugar biosynthesis glycosyltransferase [Aetokthonos hydrillicola Thurmond2011]
MPCVSIIIPTLNEAVVLDRTLRQLTILDPPAGEVIVVDGGSEDQTIEVAKRVCELFARGIKLQVLSCPKRGRSIQMNYAARAATGDILCLLHADTWVPDDLIAVIEQTLAEPAIACGGFISLMVGSRSTRWGISLHNYLKTYYAPLMFKPHMFLRGLRLLFGDQVMFCRRNDFWDCGGFNEELPIMEDGDLCLRLFTKGRIYLVKRVVQSSDRRVARWGSWKATAIYFYIGFLWGIGVNTTYLKKFYEDIR